jgi:hypothetical protein
MDNSHAGRRALHPQPPHSEAEPAQTSGRPPSAPPNCPTSDDTAVYGEEKANTICLRTWTKGESERWELSRQSFCAASWPRWMVRRRRRVKVRSRTRSLLQKNSCGGSMHAGRVTRFQVRINGFASSAPPTDTTPPNTAPQGDLWTPRKDSTCPVSALIRT